MDRKASWEFDCPQFIDFCSDVEETFRSPAIDFPEVRRPRWAARPTQFEFKVPQLLTIKKKLMFNSKISTPVQISKPLKNPTDSDKCKALGILSKRLSKSVGSLNVVVNQQHPAVIDEEFQGLGRRSVSEPDVRARKKCCTTPMCLKRVASTKKFKTTEELELEKIAELRKQTFQKLRRNEMNLRRMRMNKNPTSDLCKRVAKVEIKNKEHCNKPAFKRADYNIIKENVNNFKKNARKNVEAPCAEQSRLNSHFTEAGPSTSKDVELFHQPRMTPQEISIGQMVAAVRPKKIFPNLHNDGHSGLYFAPSSKKVTACKPFNFQNRVQEMGSVCKQPVKPMCDFNNKEIKNAEINKLKVGNLRTAKALFAKDVGKENMIRPRPSRSVNIN